MRKIARTATTMRHQGERCGASDSGGLSIRSANLGEGAVAAGMGWMEGLMPEKRKSNERSNSRSMQIQLEESA
jgi:hypothetical protein